MSDTAYIQYVPPLGFEGETYAPNKRSVLIPSPKGLIQVYAHSGHVEGYNVFFPERVVPVGNETVEGERVMSYALTVKSPFEVKMAVQGYIGGLLPEVTKNGG